MTTEPTGRTARLLRRGAVPSLLAGLLLGPLAGCSAADDASSDTLAPTSSGAVTAAPATSPDPSPTSSAAIAPPGSDPAVVDLPDGPSLLDQALAAAAAGYHFVSTVTVGSEVALTAEGDRVGDGTRMTVTSNGATVGYVITKDGSWVEQDGTWQELADPAPTPDPIAALRTPASVVVTAQDGDVTTLVAAYPASTLGLTGDAPVEVTVTVTAGSLTSLSYAPPGATPPTTVVTSIGPLVDPAPVTIPTL